MKAQPFGWAFLCDLIASFGKPWRIAKAKGEVFILLEIQIKHAL
jgi:hypothetical protein